MELFSSPDRRYRPMTIISQNDDYNDGAEVKDIPFYRPSSSLKHRKKSIDIAPVKKSMPHTHELSALISEPETETMLHVPSRSSSRAYVHPEGYSETHPEEAKDPAMHDRPGSRNGPPSLRQAIPYREAYRPPMSPSTARSRSGSLEGSERSSYETGTTSLPALQARNLVEQDHMEPVDEEDIDPGSFDLVAPPDSSVKQYSLETRSEHLFSKEHLQIIFEDPTLLLRFTSFLSSHRTSSIPILMYYLDVIKALKAISYSNAIVKALEPISGFDFTIGSTDHSYNKALEEKAAQAFNVMVKEDLPAYIAHQFIQTVSLSIQQRITGTLTPALREASEGLAEVFCLTDPSRPDNPIVFASEEFHRTTQYGMSHVIGRNCRFLQGPKTNPFSSKRIRAKIEAGVEHCECFLNYRRDGSPFMNLLMIAPLRDSRGTIRYFIGAQVDVSGLVKECSDLESLRILTTRYEADNGEEAAAEAFDELPKDEFTELSEMLNFQELDTVRRCGGRMRKEGREESAETNFQGGNWNKGRVLIDSGSPDESKAHYSLGQHGRLSGIYENYLLVRPYPTLRILFASPSLRVPGILQSPFMAKIGGNGRVRDELTRAFADGRGVTAKIKWVSKKDLEGRSRWIHCTPLIGSNGAVGVWMIVIVDDEESTPAGKRYRMAPPVNPSAARIAGRPRTRNGDDNRSMRDFEYTYSAHIAPGSPRGRAESLMSHNGDRSGSPYTLRLD